jgi:hypothetical protein
MTKRNSWDTTDGDVPPMEPLPAKGAYKTPEPTKADGEAMLDALMESVANGTEGAALDELRALRDCIYPRPKDDRKKTEPKG